MTTITESDQTARIALDWLVRSFTPAWLDLAGLTREADELRAIELVDTTAVQAVRKRAETASDAAGPEAWEAAWNAVWHSGAPARRLAWDDRARTARLYAVAATQAAADTWAAACETADWDSAMAARDVATAARWAARAAEWDIAADAVAAVWDIAGAAAAAVAQCAATQPTPPVDADWDLDWDVDWDAEAAAAAALALTADRLRAEWVTR